MPAGNPSMNFLPEPISKWLDGIQVNMLSLILWIAAIWTLATLLVRTVKKSIPALKNLIELSESLTLLPDWMEKVEGQMEDQKVLLEEVRQEVLPNNGGSMRDDLETVSLQVAQLKAHQLNKPEVVDDLEDTITRRLENKLKERTDD